MRLFLLSDIHANVTALEAVLADMGTMGKTDSVAVLGDLVNYGLRPNETIRMIRDLASGIMVNIWGNHEYSIFGGSLDKFSTDRGRAVLQYTHSILTHESRAYLDKEMEHGGFQEREIEGRKFLFIHGALDDPYWGKLGIDEMKDGRFAQYDYVVSGHTHVPHYVEYFFSSANAVYRHKKRTVFINPGSVGQPRNQNPFAQYGILDTCSGNYEHRSVRYDVVEEQKHFSDKVDVFYRERLTLGI